MSAINRATVIANAKAVITNGINLLREAGLSAEEVASIVFACSMDSGSVLTSTSGVVSSASSVDGDSSAVTEKRKPGRPKKERDPDAPKRPGNPKFLEAIARAKKWYEDVYIPSWETRKDEWRVLYNRLPIKEGAKRTRVAFPEDKPIGPQIAQSIYKLLNAPSADEVAAKKDAAKKSKQKKSIAAATSTPAAESSDSEGDFYPLELDGQNYIYDDLNRTWFLAEDGSKGDWAGIYDPANNTLDDTVEEPVA